MGESFGDHRLAVFLNSPLLQTGDQATIGALQGEPLCRVSEFTDHSCKGRNDGKREPSIRLQQLKKLLSIYLQKFGTLHCRHRGRTGPPIQHRDLPKYGTGPLKTQNNLFAGLVRKVNPDLPADHYI